jgi:hypothetical protein
MGPTRLLGSPAAHVVWAPVILAIDIGHRRIRGGTARRVASWDRTRGSGTVWAPPAWATSQALAMPPAVNSPSAAEWYRVLKQRHARIAFIGKIFQSYEGSEPHGLVPYAIHTVLHRTRWGIFAECVEFGRAV